MSYQTFEQAFTARRRAMMVARHFTFTGPYLPDPVPYETFQHDLHSPPMRANSGVVAPAHHQALPSISHLIGVADHYIPPATLIEYQENVRYPVVAGPSPTPSTPMGLSPVSEGTERSSEGPSVVPVSKTKLYKRKLSDTDPEFDIEVTDFLADKAKRIRILPTPPKKAIAYGSDSKTNHNMSQTILRGHKGSKRLTMQRTLCSRGWYSHRLQKKKNALSSGLVYEEEAVLEASTQMMVFANVLRDIFFKGKHQEDITAMLSDFQPDMIQPEDNSQAAKFKVMKEAEEPFRWQDMRGEGEIRRVLEKLRSLSTGPGQQGIDEYLNNMSKPAVARL